MGNSNVGIQAKSRHSRTRAPTSQNDPRQKCIGARSKFGRFLRAYSTAMGATYPRSFAMIAVSPAAVSATRNTIQRCSTSSSTPMRDAIPGHHNTSRSHP